MKSWFVQVPKTMEFILDYQNETLLFVKVSRSISSTKRGTRTATKLVTEEVMLLNLEEIRKRIADPGYILIKIIKEDENNGDRN